MAPILWSFCCASFYPAQNRVVRLAVASLCSYAFPIVHGGLFGCSGDHNEDVLFVVSGRLTTDAGCVMKATTMTTVDELPRAYSVQLGGIVRSMKFYDGINNGKPMADGNTLLEYGVVSDVTISIVLAGDCLLAGANDARDDHGVVV